MEFLKNFLGNHKKAVIAFLVPAVLFIIAVFVVAAKLTWDERAKNREFERKTKEFQEALEKPYREDVYGGKTPEETWELFLDALLNDDIDLASKYFVVDKREEELKFFLQEKNIDDLQLFKKQIFSELKKESNYLQRGKAYFYYELKDEKTNKVYSNSVVFYLNTYTKVWKILVL